MNQSESQLAGEKLARLAADFKVNVEIDWGGSGADKNWKPGNWSVAEIGKLQDALSLLSGAMGGGANFIKNIGGATVKKAAIGTHGGEALAHDVKFSLNSPFTSWTVVHEFAHAWDANNDWRLSRKLERYTGGFTSTFLSALRKYFGSADLNGRAYSDEPGKRGRKAGCNVRGYFYGDKPSGSDWNFNRVEDFAESVAMYIGWSGNNALTDHAHARISRYLLANGETDPFFRKKENWVDYKKYFYPENGDYTQTLHWKFVDGLMQRGQLRL